MIVKTLFENLENDPINFLYKQPKMSTLNAVSIRPQQGDSPLKVTNGEIDRNMKYLANI